MFAGRARRALKDTGGAAALEFAMVAPFFFLIVFFTFETGWLMTQTMMLDRAVDRTVRLLRLGAMEETTYEGVKNEICEEAMIIGDCQTSLTVELTPITTAADFPEEQARCIQRGAEVQPVMNFNPGARSQIVFIRVCATVEPLSPFVGNILRLNTDPDGNMRIIASSAFANEPG